jgi:hypothetical protein
MNGAEIGVFKQGYQVGFTGLLKSQDGGRLEAQVVLEILRDFTDKTLEKKERPCERMIQENEQQRTKGSVSMNKAKDDSSV